VKQEVLNIAIVSTNKDKYSETFIQNHVKLLPGNIHFLYEGYLPTRYSLDRGLTGQSFQKYERNKWFNFRKRVSENEKNNLTDTIERYLAKNEVDVILCEYGPSGVELMPIAKHLNVPLVVHFHGYDAYRDDILNSYGKSYVNLFKDASAVIAVSRHMQQHLITLGCQPSKLHCLPCGVSLNLFQPTNKPKNEIIFVSCGRFVPKKSPASTIKAFAKVLGEIPDAKLRMIGDGELLDNCIDLCKNFGISNSVEFKGQLSPFQVAETLRESFAFVQHSITTSENDSEGTPLTILESGACGLPVISTRHGGIPDVIIEGETGFLVEENDIEGMAERMLYLVRNPELASDMGKKASQHIRANYNLEKNIKNLARILKSAVTINT
jgi:colanic acid/amylovoran biosynthesis glycosyltransferase